VTERQIVGVNTPVLAMSAMSCISCCGICTINEDIDRVHVTILRRGFYCDCLWRQSAHAW